MKNLKEQLSKFKGARILDIGTGRGSFIQMIMAVNNDYTEIIGIDNSDKVIEMAEKSFSDSRISFRKMDVDDMTFDKNTFDVVCLSNSMHHMSDINDCIDKMAEMLKDDGILIFNEMISDNKDDMQMTHTYMHHFWAEIDRLSGVVHKETMTRQEILDVFNYHPKVNVIRSWDVDYDEQQELSKEEYDWLKNTLDKSLERVKDHLDFKDYEYRVQQLKKRLDDIGFKSATQVIVIAGVAEV